MNDFDIGPSTIPRVEVDEEPPGSPCQSYSYHSTLPVQQRLWPLTHPEPPRRESPAPAIVARPPRSSARVRAFRKAFYRDVTDKQWNDWRWHARSRIRTREQLEKMVELSADEREGLDRAGEILPVATTPYYMSLISADDPQQPLRRTIIPTASEFTQTRGESADPLGEDHEAQPPEWSTVIRIACCFWPWISVPATAVIAPVRGSWARATSSPTRPG